MSEQRIMALRERLVGGQIVLQISRSQLLTYVVSITCKVKNDWAALDIHCKVHPPCRKQINKK